MRWMWEYVVGGRTVAARDEVVRTPREGQLRFRTRAAPTDRQAAQDGLRVATRVKTDTHPHRRRRYGLRPIEAWSRAQQSRPRGLPSSWKARSSLSSPSEGRPRLAKHTPLTMLQLILDLARLPTLVRAYPELDRLGECLAVSSSDLLTDDLRSSPAAEDRFVPRAALALVPLNSSSTTSLRDPRSQ